MSMGLALPWPEGALSKFGVCLPPNSSKRQRKYFRKIIRSPHRPRISGDRTGTVVLLRELRDAVRAYADITESGGQTHRPHEVAHHIASTRARSSELLGHGPLALGIDRLVPFERGGKRDAGGDAMRDAGVGAED